jgi:hypothetical protein
VLGMSSGESVVRGALDTFELSLSGWEGMTLSNLGMIQGKLMLADGPFGPRQRSGAAS